MSEPTRMIAASALLMVLAAIVGGGAALWMEPGDYPWAIKVIGGLWLLCLLFLKIVVQEVRATETFRRATARMAEAEANFKSNPDKPQVIWDLARTKLESYVDRNLEQVRRIFFLTSVVMVGGLVLVTCGIVSVYRDSTVIAPSVVAAMAGTLTEAIGATLFFVYRSVMKQADAFVAILERMNVVGMAMQMLDQTQDVERRDEKIAEIAGELMRQYAQMR